MKKITTAPKFDDIMNFDLRSAFECDNVIDTSLEPCGYVGNRPSDCEDEEHEDDTWAIDQYNEDGEVMESFLYTSEWEYQEDCKLLGL